MSFKSDYLIKILSVLQSLVGFVTQRHTLKTWRSMWIRTDSNPGVAETEMEIKSD